MKPGAVLVDVAIDQGGCAETVTADDALRPGVRRRRRHPLLRREHARRGADHVDEGADERDAAVRRGDRRRTASRAAVARDPALARGVNVLDGKVTYEAVAEAHGLEYTPLEDVLPLAAGLASAGRASAGFGFGVFAGESLTTTQVTPAASAIDARR